MNSLCSAFLKPWCCEKGSKCAQQKINAINGYDLIEENWS